MESGNVGECLLLYESTVQRTSVCCTLMTLQITLKYFGYYGHNGQIAVDSGGGGRRTGNYGLIWSGPNITEILSLIATGCSCF